MHAGRAGHSAPQSGQRIGPYLIGAEIGAGAMGVVYDAVHAEHGEDVALKTVRLPQAGLLSSIRREIHALHRLLRTCGQRLF